MLSYAGLRIFSGLNTFGVADDVFSLKVAAEHLQSSLCTYPYYVTFTPFVYLGNSLGRYILIDI